MRKHPLSIAGLTLAGMLLVPPTHAIERTVVRAETSETSSHPPTTRARARATDTQATFPDTTGELIRVRLHISEAPEGPLAKVLVDTDILAHEGAWGTFEKTSELTYPTAYAPPTIPTSVTGTVKGGGTLTTPTVTLETNPSESFMPPHPEGFTTRIIGLKVRVRPMRQSDGTIHIETEIEHSALGGFVDQGIPVIESRPRSFGKHEKTIPRLDNAQRIPIFIDQSSHLTFTPSRDIQTIAAQTREPSHTYSETFAIDYSRESIPEVIVTATAEPIQVPEVTKPRRDEAGHDQIYVTTRIIEIKSDSPTREDIAALPVLTESQFQVLIRELNRKRGVDLLSAPSVMLRPGQLGNVEVLREFIYPTQFDPPKRLEADSNGAFPVSPATPINFDQRNIGLSTTLAARPAPNGMIDLQVGPTATEFTEFLDFGEPILIDGKGLFGRLVHIHLTENRISTPIFAKRQIGTTVRIPDGATLLCEGPVREEVLEVEDSIPVISAIPGLKQATTRKSTHRTYRHLYILITPKVVDSAGRPLAK